MAWHRDSVSGSGLLLVFQVFIKKNGKMDLLVIEGWDGLWACRAGSYATSPVSRSLKENFK